MAADETGRVVVADILEQSDAYRRGLRMDDELVSFGGRPITTPNGFKNVLGILPKGWRVPMSFRREGKRFDVTVRLAGLHGSADLLEKTVGPSAGARCPFPSPAIRPSPATRTSPATGKDAAEAAAAARAAPSAPSRHARPEPMPEIVKKYFEEKPGYANYYFNKLNQDRVWKAWTAKANFAGLGGTWTIAGDFDGRTKVRFEMTDAGVVLKRPRRRASPGKPARRWAPRCCRPAAAACCPPSILWRRLALEGLQHFGRVEYLGTAPLPGYDGLADVLVGHVQGGGMLVLFRSGPGRAAGPGNVSGGQRRSLRGLFFRLPRRGRPPAAGADGSPHRPTVLFGVFQAGPVHLRQRARRSR